LTRTVPVAAVIPTYGRGAAVLRVLDEILACDPRPSEVWVHIDQADGTLEHKLSQEFPNVRVLTSTGRLGPGGGRHRCLQTCTTPYAVSFDDDSYPLDRDFFFRVDRLFSEHLTVAILAARIWHRNDPQPGLDETLRPVPSYVGCGCAVRTAAYRAVRGYLPRPVAYGMEETDVSLQLFAAGWLICEAGSLRVFHDTELKHHGSPAITSGTITNIGLYAFLNYPVAGWGWGFLQLVNKIAYFVRVGRFKGICSGLLNIFLACYCHRRSRNPVPFRTMRRFIRFCRSGVPETRL
jgi:GT2 family glycosyltransferase